MTELPELLGQLEDEWGRRGVPLGQLRPGVSRDEVETKVRALPLDLDPPEELYEWYAWHDGSTWQDCDTARANDGFFGEMPLLPGLDQVVPLDRACELTASWIDIFEPDEIVPDQGNCGFVEWAERHDCIFYARTHFHLLGSDSPTYTTLSCVGGDTGRVYKREIKDVSLAEPLDSLADLIRGYLRVYAMDELHFLDFPEEEIHTMDQEKAQRRDPLIAKFL